MKEVIIKPNDKYIFIAFIISIIINELKLCKIFDFTIYFSEFIRKLYVNNLIDVILDIFAGTIECLIIIAYLPGWIIYFLDEYGRIGINMHFDTIYIDIFIRIFSIVFYIIFYCIILNKRYKKLNKKI